MRQPFPNRTHEHMMNLQNVLSLRIDSEFFSLKLRKVKNNLSDKLSPVLYRFNKEQDEFCLDPSPPLFSLCLSISVSVSSLPFPLHSPLFSLFLKPLCLYPKLSSLLSD